jgi:hypothetical protein
VSKAWCDAETDEKVAFIGGKGSGLGGVFLEEEAIEDRDQVHGSRGGGQNNSFDVGVRSDRGAKDRVAGGYGGPVSSEEGVSLLLEGGEPGIAEVFDSWTEDSRHPPPGGWVREGRAIAG